MNINFAVGTFFVFFVLYWAALSKLIDSILESPKLKQSHWIAIGVFNALVIFSIAAILPNMELLYYSVVIAIMLIELSIFYKDKFAAKLMCTLACSIHIIALFMITISAFSLSSGYAPYEILAQDTIFLQCCMISFFFLDIAILSVLQIVPLPKIKLINQHTEQLWFMITWMFVSSVFLFFIGTLFNNPDYPAKLSIIQMTASIAMLMGVYIVLFFSIKSSALIGYREKNAQLEQKIHQEQQYRNFMVRDAIASYEVNVTQDTLIKGTGEYDYDIDNMGRCYTSVLILMSQKFIYSEDIQEFVRNCGRTNMLRLFEKGEREFITEYRRILTDNEYVWVRAIANLTQNTENGDVKAFVCVKNIDAEKKNQLELQWKAERDPLTGLYNRATVNKLIDEHIAFGHSGSGSALFMIDVDNFKEINDNLGHLFGDAVLCELAEKLTSIFRSTDIVGRIGGDEYIVFLKDNATITSAQMKAEDVCKAFYVTYQGSAGNTHTISGSIGISFFPNDGKNFKELYSNADVALYLAKSEGKNKYKLYDGSNFTAYSAQRTEIQATSNTLQKGFRENRIEYVFKMLYQSTNPVAAIHAVLELVSRHFCFERGYIFETSKDGKTSSNTFEWCAEGVIPEIYNLQKIPIEAVATAHSHFQESGTFVLKSLDDLKPIERAVLEPQGIKSMFQFGIFDKRQLLGFIGFDNCKSESIPDDVEIDEMKTICNILATFFVKQYIDDVTEKDLLARQEVMNHLENYIYVIKTETFELLFMNEKIRTLLNPSNKKNVCYEFFRGNSSQCEDCPLRQIAHEGTSRLVSEIYNHKLDIWMETSASLMRWTDGSTACLINCTDITKQKNDHLHHVDELEKLLYVDSLTGGRTYHKFQIDAHAILNRQPDMLHALIKLDVSNFKLVNQLYGFEKGNEILRCISKAIEQTTRNENEIFSRMNNDEFIALFTIENKEEIGDLNKAFVDYVQDFVGDDFSFKLKFPHGRYIIEPGDAKNISVNDMFEKVNIAHKTAKLNKTLDFVFYDEQMTKEALRVKEIENKMAYALDNGEFCVYLQPKYTLSNETIGGAEALSRWGRENDVYFSPNIFIPIFEQNGFITKLDFYVFKKTCQTIRLWTEMGIEPVKVSVNFSRLHLGNPNFVKELCKIVDAEGINRKYLEIEITETVIFDNIDTLEILVADIHKSGFSMSMDDFGSGYSSLGMLKDFPVDVIKMDRSFFANQRDATRSKTVVGHIIQMATELGIRIVAEGVEEQTHIDLLRELHCDMVQGYYYAKPMTLDAFTQLLLKERKFKQPVCSLN